MIMAHGSGRLIILVATVPNTGSSGSTATLVFISFMTPYTREQFSDLVEQAAEVMPPMPTSTAPVPSMTTFT